MTQKQLTKLMEDVRRFRETLLTDPYRPLYHFTTPDSIAIPGDPNGAFYANGRYHLMYLYENSLDGYRWGHVSSTDLVHWTHHPDALIPGDGDGGCFSGGAFVDEDNTAYLSYWKLPVEEGSATGGGIGIARSSDTFYEKWEKMDVSGLSNDKDWGIMEIRHQNGNIDYIGCADPSNIWKKDDTYYLQTGNLLVLNKYGREGDSPKELTGDWVDLFKSSDLKNWEYVHRFYKRDASNKWTDETEDDMCPSFLPLPNNKYGTENSGKYLQLFISHNKGCQYYIGDYRNDQFFPQTHGRMTWNDPTYFAPEALIAPDGRQIMWAWLTDNIENESENGWSGVYGLPRNLWLGEDNTLRMAPVEELQQLRYNKNCFEDVTLKHGEKKKLEEINGVACELSLKISIRNAQKVGVKVRVSTNEEEETLLYYDTNSGTLCFDARKSGNKGRTILEQAPLKLVDGEELELRVFVDKSVVEIYANERQAITRRVYPTDQNSQGVYLYCEGGNASFKAIEAWEMMAANPY